MATSRERRQAQRATARFVRESRTARDKGRERPHILPTAIRAPSKAAMERYANDVLTGKEPLPAQGTPEAKQLARMASLASRGKADPRFEGAFKQFWYHKAKDEKSEAEIDEESDYDSDEDDEDEE